MRMVAERMVQVTCVAAETSVQQLLEQRRMSRPDPPRPRPVFLAASQSWPFAMLLLPSLSPSCSKLHPQLFAPRFLHVGVLNPFSWHLSG